MWTAGGPYSNFSGVQGVQIRQRSRQPGRVRQVVFEEKSLSAESLLDTLKNNYFRGQEVLRQRLINRVPKYGNDDERVDWLQPQMGGPLLPNWWNSTKYTAAGLPAGFYTRFSTCADGKPTWRANSPDRGRLAGEPLADGGLSPQVGGCARSHGSFALGQQGQAGKGFQRYLVEYEIPAILF